MPVPARYPDNYLGIIEQALREFFPRPEIRAKPVYDAMEYSLFSGGKRLRPILTLLAAEAAGGKPDQALPTACAIEFIHTYSLIHDDLPSMDNDNLRRGRPTCHIKFGEDIAILAGDALLTEAFYLISSRQSPGNRSKTLQVLDELSEAIGVRGMVGGQVEDIGQAGNINDIETIKHIHTLKTGKLITASARSGAIIADASADALSAITDYAENLGLAFQITDDVLDVVGNTEIMGKNVGSDAKQSKATFPAVLGLEKSREYANQAIGLSKNALKDIHLVRVDKLLELADFVLERDS